MGAHKDRLIQAAELLDMSPDDLLTLLDADADASTWGWQGDPREAGDDRPERPAPEGLGVFAHWSASHDGINVELDVPDGLRVTVHYNDALMIDQQVSEDGTVAYNRMPRLDRDGSHSVMCICPQCTEDDEQPDREPTPAQEEAWDAREDEARGHALG